MKNENLLSTETILKVHDHMNNLYYFHGWSWEERIAIHPEDPSKDHKYSVKINRKITKNERRAFFLTQHTKP